MLQSRKFDSIPDALLFLVNEYGNGILHQQNVIGLLSDLLGGEYPMYPVFKRAVQRNIGLRIYELSQRRDIFDVKYEALKYSFQEENFLEPQAASYIIDSFAYALGLIQSVAPYCKGKESVSGVPSFVDCHDGEFCGYVNSENERCGYGILKEQNGDYYVGEWKLDMRMGLGIGCGSSREKYAGQWRYNKQEGIGVKLLQDGSIYSGQWKNGEPHGRGTIYYPNGEWLLGTFKYGDLQYDVCIKGLQDGSTIQGGITSEGLEGLCFHTSADGQTIVEEYWHEGKLNNNY